jgi:hypothetical protein
MSVQEQLNEIAKTEYSKNICGVKPLPLPSKVSSQLFKPRKRAQSIATYRKPADNVTNPEPIDLPV